MLSSSETIVPLASSNAQAPRTTLYFDPLFDQSPASVVSSVPRSFRRHKTLPHPRKRKGERPAPAATESQSHSLTSSIDTTSSLRSSSASSLEYEIRVTGPDLPPTPPTNSQGASSSRSDPVHGENPAPSLANTSSRTPGTPPNQKSPPTPDVTPPKAERPPNALRPLLSQRLPSKATTATDSRSASYTTAPENPYSSEEDEHSTRQAALQSERSGSQSTVRPAADSTRKKSPKDVGLGLGLESEDDHLKLESKREFFTFDGKWSPPNEVEQGWDDNVRRNVAVRKQRTRPEHRPERNMRKSEVIDDAIIPPTNATEAVRSMTLQEPSQDHHLTKDSVERARRWAAAPSNSEANTSADPRRSSGMSSKSTVSTVVEAVLVEAQPKPRRQKTLRHVKKQMGLRNSSSEFSASSSAATLQGPPECTRRPRVSRRIDTDPSRTDSQVSTGSVNSVASRKARREVWKNGGIPVVVIPDRSTSVKSTNTVPSLRSTGSQRSKKSNSLSSAPFTGQSKTKELSNELKEDLTPLFDRPSRRGRALSESDGSYPTDQLTMDYPPIVPIRRSSRSAPTSQNGSRATSRAGSLTAESLKAHNAIQQEQEQESQRPAPQVTVERIPSFEYISGVPDPSRLEPVASAESHRDAHDSNRSVSDHNGDHYFGKRLTAHNTPFSQASVETNGTHSAADISEAMAVNIYPHQNKSVLMVHHLSKQPDSANALQSTSKNHTGRSTGPEVTRDTPEITANGPGGGPVTPPRPRMSMDDVDSPLRNPRAPPVPPAIQFIPATPSGLTPAAEKEKMLGNYFEEMQKRPSLVRRAFSLRKNSDSTTPRAPGFLTRTFSYSRNLRKDAVDNSASHKAREHPGAQYTPRDVPSHDETKLHPFWRPSSEIVDDDDDDDYVYDVPDEVEKIYRYPPMERRRSLSDRMKRTFAILPVQNDEHYTSAGQRSPERRTIRRSPSGHLRVMRSRSSYGSLQWSNPHSYEQEDGRPSTAPDRASRRAWGTEKRVDSQGRRLFPGWQDKVQQYGLHNLQRRLSEHRRLKRTQELRQKISGPREVRDGVGEVIKRNSYKGPSYQSAGPLARASTDGAIDGIRRRSYVH